MNHIKAKEQRYVESRLIHSDVLQAIDLLWISYEEERADLLTADALFVRDERRRVLRDLRHLPDLFVERHLRHQFADKAMHLGVRTGATLPMHCQRRESQERGQSTDSRVQILQESSFSPGRQCCSVYGWPHDEDGHHV